MVIKTVPSAHDKFFRGAMSNLRVAKEFLQTYLPLTIRAAIDLESLLLMPTSYVDTSLKASFSDVVYQAKLKNGPLAYICVLLCEHQSTVDPLMPLRIWRYVLNNWTEHVKQQKERRPTLPLVIPLVFYTGMTPYTGATDIRELIQGPAALIEEALFQRTFKLIELNRLSEEEFKQQQWAGTMAWMMRHIWDADVLESLKQIWDTLRNLEVAGDTDFVELLLNYCLTSGETLQIQKFETIVHQGTSPATGAKIMTIAEQLIQKGKAEGKMEGKMEGEQMLLRTIILRAVEQGLPLATICQLSGWSEEEIRVLQQSSAH